MSLTSHSIVGAVCFGLGVLLADPVKKGAEWTKDKAVNNRVVAAAKEGYRRGKERVGRRKKMTLQPDQVESARAILEAHGISVVDLTIEQEEEVEPAPKWGG